MVRQKFEVTFLLADDDQTDSAVMWEILSDIVRKGFQKLNEEIIPDYHAKIEIRNLEKDFDREVYELSESDIQKLTYGK